MGFESSKGKKKEEITRRGFLKATRNMALAAGALGAAGMFVRASESEKHRIEHDRQEAAKPLDLTFLEAEPHMRAYAMDALEGRKLGPQFARYFGIDSDAIKNVEQMDFKFQLAQLWQQKFDLLRGDEPEEEYAVHHEGVLPAIEHLYRSYEPPRPGEGETILNYRRSAFDSIQSVKNEFNSSELSKRFVLKQHQLKAIERFMTSIDPELLLSYAITELMPSNHGGINVDAFDFLLQNAGRGYVERIPALGDRLLSFGPYQFTSIALRDSIDAKNRPVLHGASRIDATLRHSQIPPNVVSLRGDDHHKAAYLFAAYNLTHLAKDIGEQACEELLRHQNELDDAVRDYVIAAHHRPAEARSAFKKLMEHKRKVAHGAKQKTLSDFCKPDVCTYVKKAQINRKAVVAKMRNNK
jgi:hypothetical protein